MKIIFVDFDGTLTAPRRDGVTGVVFNIDLIAELAEKQKNGAIIVGFISYLLEFNLAQNLKFHSTRLEIIRECENKGLTFDSIITTASPYAEVIDHQEFGAYYADVIKPIEEEALSADADNRQVVIEKHLQSEEPFLTENEQTSPLRGKYRVFSTTDPLAHRKGKEEMFRYAIQHYQERYAKEEGTEFEVYDDNGKVIDVANLLKEKEGINITANLVEFHHEVRSYAPGIDSGSIFGATTDSTVQVPVSVHEGASAKKGCCVIV